MFNYCQKKIKILLLLIPFLGAALAPLKIQAATSADSVYIRQQIVKALSAINNGNALSAEFDTDDKSADKNDKIEINKNFYLCLLLDLLAVTLLIVFVYYPNYKKLDTVFTFLLFNIVIFLMTFVLNKVKISMGAAFGLFAVFSMLRYRTAGIGMKDMTYLFIFIALGLVSGIQLEYKVLVVIVSIIFVVTLLMDAKYIFHKESSGVLRYEKIEMIKPEMRTELINDLCQRTGLKIHRVTVSDIDFLKDSAMITYYYYG
jgi:hypothetical protein